MQKVTTAYTKDNNQVNFVQTSEVLYADKKKSTKLLRTIGFQMPIELQQSGYVGSISCNNQNVNISGKKFSDVFINSEQSQQRTDTLTDRELLSVAAEQISILTNLTDGERDALRILRTARTKNSGGSVNVWITVL